MGAPVVALMQRPSVGIVPKVFTPRLRVLAHVISELAANLGACDSTVKTIERGINHHLLKEVSLYGLTPNDLAAIAVVFEIDWMEHEVWVSGPNCGAIKLSIDDDAEPISGQIEPIYKDLVPYFHGRMEDWDVIAIEAHYTFRDEIRRNPEDLACARRLLGTKPTDPIEWEEGKRVDIEATPEGLSELRTVWTEVVPADR